MRKLGIFRAVRYPFKIVQPELLYQNRCALILNKNESIESYLDNPDSVRLVTNDKAEKLHIYD